MPDVPDDIDNDDDDDDDAMLKFFSQHIQVLTSLQRATIYQNNFANHHRHACCMWQQYKTRDMAIINLKETIIQCIYLDWVYSASVIRLSLIDGASSHADARNKSYQF